MKLKNYEKLEATLHLKSGLHIGTGKDPGKGEPIPVIESLNTGLPYIPGSSLKGKMRSLLELMYGRTETDPRNPGSPCWCGKCQICLLFGGGSASKASEPTRLIFRDSFLTDTSAGNFESIGLEEKPGVQIDRNTGKAAGKALFPMNRVPDGSDFRVEISVRVFEGDDEDAIKDWLEMGLYLMEQDTLGGGGTRGSGHIEIKDVCFMEKILDKKWKENCKKKVRASKDIKTEKSIKKTQ